MARNFGGITGHTYQGSPQPAAIKLSGIAGMSVPLILQWSSYGAATTPNVGVNVDLSTQDTQKSLIQIRSVYIDNMGSQNPVYIIFPDTGYIVVAKPNSAGWFPVYTNQFTLTCYGLGFIPQSLPTTKILITNLDIQASTDIELDQSQPLWLASSTITRGSTIYNQNLGSPALGDQYIEPIIDTTLANSVSNLFGTPYSSGFVYVTDFSIFVANPRAAVDSGIQLFFESLGVAGVFLSPTYSQLAGTAFPGLFINQSRAQWKLDATQTWRVRNSLVAGSIQGVARFSFSFTINPN